MARAPWRIPLAAAASLVLSANVMTLADANAYAAAQPARPSAANTGVPPGTTLTRHDGNITITQTGTVLKDLDVHGFVIVEASNVTIEQSILRGGVSHGDTALVKVVSGTNVLVEDSELVPEFPSVQIDGIRGANYRVLRDNIHGTTDGSKVTGDNVTITDSYVHDLHFTGNYADGGNCTVNLVNNPRASMTGIQVDDNRFGRNTSIANCAIFAKYAVTLTDVADVWDDTGLPVTLRRAH
ncbi:MAG TPA: hypothetical protein VIL94_02035 [Acidothermaceae bacterium]|jgi:hypothetical protein